MQRRPFFREQALRQYIQRYERNVLPQMVASPFFFCLWLLLLLFVAAALFTWSIEVPTYTTANGVLGVPDGTGTSQAVVFIPPSASTLFHNGMPVEIQIDATGPWLNGSVAKIVPGVISPDQARQRYNLGNTAEQGINQPSQTMMIAIQTQLPAHTRAGSLVSMRAQTGSQDALSLIL